MSMLDLLSQPSCWEVFYRYRTSLACPKGEAEEWRAFIDGQSYLPVCGRIAEQAPFPLPRKRIISKQSTRKKRTVYTYPKEENNVLKLLTCLLLRRYDGLFADNLFSFRPGRSAKDAVRKLARISGIGRMYSYKVDVRDYFNSIPVPRLLPMLEEAVGEDAELSAFLGGLLSEPRVLEKGREVEESKGIMAGTPLSSFYANLYLKDLDWWFYENRIPYARYSDDIILFARTGEEAWQYAQTVRLFLADRGLSVNPAKESFRTPEEGFIFLGFSFREGVIDIAPASVTKLKQKMRRKTRALQRWKERNGTSGEKAAAAFIRIFNRKLLESPMDNDLTWRFWFFSVINTAESLRSIDAYAQDCLRFLISGKRTKSRYRVRYEDLKKLGYRSLVHAYYDFEKDTAR